MKWITKSDLNVGIFPVLDVIAPRLEFYFSSRTGGVSPAPFNSLNLGTGLGDTRENVDQNREIILNALDISNDNLARGEQTHSSNVRIINKGGKYKKSDGFITDRTGLSIAVSTADCYPVVIYSPPENVMAAIHVGRKGASGGIISKTLRKMIDQFLINPEKSISILGPGICRKCYRINKNIASQFEGKVIKKGEDRYYLDLALFIKNELKRYGIKRRNIFSSGICTCCSHGLCFSYRREKTTGRHWTLATIR